MNPWDGKPAPTMSELWKRWWELAADRWVIDHDGRKYRPEDWDWETHRPKVK